ncbi:hypothetical protein WJX74_002508 [Apatococcus lobatus]|uniref:Uncharacterized protein n=1 Tax=Apatococcus lobatus TaxID=904363 RepID=A0AAW1RCY9_9CHLO
MLLRGLKWLVTPWLLSDSGAAQANKALPEGKWEEFAGQCGQSGASNGLRDKATFDHPKGMCLTGAGQLIIVDSMNACIRSIDLESGMVSTLAGECGVKGAEDGPADEARFSTGITSAWCTPEGPIAIADASVRWIGAAGSFPVTPMPRPQPDPHPQPGPSKPSDQPTGAASWWGVVLWVLLGSIAGAGATAGWRTDCSAGHLRDLLSSRGSLSGPSHHQGVTGDEEQPQTNDPLLASERGRQRTPASPSATSQSMFPGFGQARAGMLRQRSRSPSPSLQMSPRSSPGLHS